MTQMHQIGLPQLVVLALVAVLPFGGKSVQGVARGLAERLSNFGGGAGSPSHPIPADDSKPLNQTRSSLRAHRLPDRDGHAALARRASYRKNHGLDARPQEAARNLRIDLH